MKDAVIDLRIVETMMAARKIARYQERVKPGSSCRWAAMSAHVRTNDCDRRGGKYRFPFKSMLSPLEAGYLHRVVEQVRLREGLDGVRKTWGKGYRVMQAETAKVVIR